MVTAPIAITIWLVWWFVSLVDGWIKPFIPDIYNPDHYLPFPVPGVGLVAALIAITIVSFAIGFGILAVSGGFQPGPEPVASPFNSTAFTPANTTAIPLEGAASGEFRITLGTGDLTDTGSGEAGVR